jgi:hypothetical protein
VNYLKLYYTSLLERTDNSFNFIAKIHISSTGHAMSINITGLLKLILSQCCHQHHPGLNPRSVPVTVIKTVRSILLSGVLGIFYRSFYTDRADSGIVFQAMFPDVTMS